RIEHLALIVRDVVVFQQLLADVEVAGLDLALGRLDGPRHHARLDGLALGQTQALHDGANTVAREDAHQRVFKGQIEARGTRVALTARTTAKLVVDTARFVPLGTDDAQAAGLLHRLVGRRPFRADLLDAGFLFFGGQRFILTHQVDHLFDTAAQHDVGTAAGHVGGNRNVPRLTGFGDNLRLASVLLGVENFVWKLVLLEQRRQACGVFDAGGTHQHGLPTFVAVANVFQDGVELLGIGLVDLIVLVDTDHGPVGGYQNRFQAVDLLEFVGFRIRRTRHARQLLVHAEVV